MTNNKAKELLKLAENTPITNETAQLIDAVVSLAKAYLNLNNKLSRIQYPDTTGQ